MAIDHSAVVQAVTQRLTELSVAERFEQAAALRDDLRSFLLAAVHGHQLAMVGACPQIVAAQAVGREWHIHVIRHGRLAGAARAQPDDAPIAVLEAAIATAEQVAPPSGALTSASREESRLVLSWLWQPGVRLVRLDGVLVHPRTGAQPVLGGLVRKAAGHTSTSGDRLDRRPAGILAGAAPLKSRLALSQPVAG